MKNFKPYYAVIFTSKRTEGDNGYNETAELMESLAKEQKGFLGLNTARGTVGITISYWESLEAIKLWKEHTEHRIAQEKGISDWYDWYNIRICKVEHEYEFLRRQES